jgi:hypothetical protein
LTQGKENDVVNTVTSYFDPVWNAKSFKESHVKDLEKLVADRQCQTEKKATDDLVNAPKHTVLSMEDLTTVLWTLGVFQMVTGES